MHTFDPLCVFSSDLPGFDPATLNGMILYYRLMTKWIGLGDNTKLSQMGCHTRGALRPVGKVFYMPMGLVVGDKSLGRERDLVPSLPGGGERVVLLVFMVVCGCVFCLCWLSDDFVCLPLFRVLASRDGNGSGLERIFTDFGYVGCGFGSDFLPWVRRFGYLQHCVFGADSTFHPQMPIGAPQS
jgi:hypothetical protein